jgi:hypothetical protein
MPIVREFRLGALALVALAGTVFVLAPAAGAAAPAQHGAMAHAPMQPTPPGGAPGFLPQGTVSSTNWSGYAATGSTFSNVSATWVEPAAICPGGSQYSSSWVGLDGYASRTVEQTGTDSDCAGTAPQYYAWWEIYPSPSVNIPKPVSAGDHMRASVTGTAAGSFTLTITDVTKGWTNTETKTLTTAKRSSAEVIEEAPCCTGTGGILPLADFGKAHFANALVDGAVLGSFNPTRINMAAGGILKDTTSALNAAGNGFTVTWHHK